MQALNATLLLEVWERGRLQSLTQRALVLLAAAQPELSLERIAALSIGQRDAQLLTLREGTFGSPIVSLADCPQCGLRVQMGLSVNDLRVSALEVADTEPVTFGDVEVLYRLPTSVDLMAVGPLTQVEMMRRALLRRCLTQVTVAGQPRSTDDLPADMLEMIEEHMAQHDPQALIQFALTCPQCTSTWSATFDIVTFFWAEINAWAHRLLTEVHTLASTYSWREADILMMSAYRRQAYLDLIQV